MALRDDVVVVKHVAEEVAVIQLVRDRRRDVGRQLLELVVVVSPQRNVQ